MPRRLYFFPALIPLAELVPWVLTLLGAVAGLAGITDFLRRHRRAILAVAALCFAGAVGAYLHYRPDLEIRMNGTALADSRDFAQSQPFDLPPPPAHAVDSPGFAFLWTYRSDTQILASPVLVGGRLIYGLYKGGIMALRAADGKPAWFLPTNEPVFALTPAGDARVYVGEGLHYTVVSALIALNPATGAIAWQRRFGGHIEETAAVDDMGNRLFLGTGPGGLWAIDTADAAILWHAAIGHIDSAPLLTGETVYAPAQPEEGSDTSAFFAIDAASGKTKWHIPLPGQPWGSPLLSKDGDMILSSSGRGQIGVARESDAGWAQGITPGGTLVWQADLPSMPIQPSLYQPGAGRIIHSLKNGDIVALDAATGALAWSVNAGGELQAPAVLAANGRLIAAVTYNGILTIRDATTGVEKVRWNVGKYSTASPIADGDVLYVPTAWFVHAFGGLNALAAQP